MYKVVLLFCICSSLSVAGQNLEWERSDAVPNSRQSFDGCVDLGNDLFLLNGQNALEYTWIHNSTYYKYYWRVIDGFTGNPLFNRYWDVKRDGFPVPFSADKMRSSIYSFAFYRSHLDEDSVVFFRINSTNLDTIIWQTPHDPNLFKTLSRWTRTMPAIDGGFIDCREKSVSGYISQSGVMKFDGLGNLEWQRQYGPANHRNFTTWMDVTRDSCYILSGIQVPLISGSPDSTWCFLQKIDRQGNEVWRKTFLVDDTLPIRDAFTLRIVCRETPDYGYLVTGSFVTSQRGYSLNAKFDSTLSLTGRKWYMPSDSAIAYGEAYSDGTSMLAGANFDLNIPFSIRRTGPNGNTIWKKTFTNPCRGANAVVFNTDSTAILAGIRSPSCFFLTSDNDFWWAKITGTGQPYNPLAVREDQVPRAQKDEGIELYPNPAQEQITLKLPAFKGEKAVVFNHLGQKMLEEWIATLRPQVSVQHLPPGLYRVRVGKWVKGFVKE